MKNKKKQIKKKVIIYKNDSDSDTIEEEEIIIKKNKPKNKEVKQPIKHLPDDNNVINNPTYKKVIKFI